MNKICNKCHLEKERTEFSIRKDSKDGIGTICKSCNQEYCRQHYKTHKEEHARKVKEWVDKNRAHKLKKQSEWYHKNKERLLKEELFRKRESRKNPTYRLRETLRSRLNQAIIKETKSGSAVLDLGCTIHELKQYLESKFQPGMTWDNWSKTGWHIDHIRPLASFDLTDPEQFKQACHYTNLQPLWAKDNLSKGDKV